MSEIIEILNKLGAETADALERFLDDKEMYLKYVRNFPEEPSMEALKEAVEKEDYVQAEKSVHALKGIVNNLGFLPLADATYDMLGELRDGNIQDALDAYEDVKEQYDKFCNAIKTWRDTE
ncbi:MAG: Hpt domain-containing protein [Clostridia bacterium]|nr:Hpt domain-containing protein [Clostridia bacterium]NCD03757.1 Hpt domain-containing protein [Clostridia bacterium]